MDRYHFIDVRNAVGAPLVKIRWSDVTEVEDHVSEPDNQEVYYILRRVGMEDFTVTEPRSINVIQQRLKDKDIIYTK